MTKVKKVFLIILITILLVFAILYTVELIDKKINGKTYEKIDAFIKQENLIFNQGNAKICATNSNYIMKSVNNGVASKFKNNLIYDETIKSCNLAIKDYEILEIPTEIPQDKKQLIKQGLDYREEGLMLSVEMIKMIKSCHGEQLCFVKTSASEFNSISELTKLPLKIILNNTELRERYSIKSILIDRIREVFIKYSIKRVDKIINKPRVTE